MSFSFPAKESTLQIVLPGVSGKTRGILLDSYNSLCSVLLLFMYPRLLWHFNMENPHRYGQSCHFPILFPPSSLSNRKHTWASHMQFNTNSMKFLFSVRKNNGQNVPIHKWHCNKLSSKSIEKRFISHKLALGKKKKTHIYYFTLTPLSVR